MAMLGVILLIYQQLNMDRIREKVSDIKISLALLQTYGTREDGEFLSNQEAIRAARYSFIVLIEASMNIANHICARLLNKAPANYAETFLLLGESGIINPDLAEKLAQMSRFRNLLVHGYAKVDDKKLLEIIRKDLIDVNEFLNEIGKITLGRGNS
jgi:uncharacterized protein YutE (UPF0331/DUF86 family)